MPGCRGLLLAHYRARGPYADALMLAAWSEAQVCLVDLILLFVLGARFPSPITCMQHYGTHKCGRGGDSEAH